MHVRINHLVRDL